MRGGAMDELIQLEDYAEAVHVSLVQEGRVVHSSPLVSEFYESGMPEQTVSRVSCEQLTISESLQRYSRASTRPLPFDSLNFWFLVSLRSARLP